MLVALRDAVGQWGALARPSLPMQVDARAKPTSRLYVYKSRAVGPKRRNAHPRGGTPGGGLGRAFRANSQTHARARGTATCASPCNTYRTGLAQLTVAMEPRRYHSHLWRWRPQLPSPSKALRAREPAAPKTARSRHRTRRPPRRRRKPQKRSRRRRRTSRGRGPPAEVTPAPVPAPAQHRSTASRSRSKGTPARRC